MAKNDEIPLPSSRAVQAGASRMRGGPVRGEPQPGVGMSAQVVAAVPHRNEVADRVANDPVMERLRSKKIKRVGLNVHVDARVHQAFQAFVDEFDVPKGDLASTALQEFLERRGVHIPGVTRLAPPPANDGNGEYGVSAGGA